MRRVHRSESAIRVVPLLLEAAFIVLGVVLGLMANEWRLNRADRQQAEAVLGAIRQELHENRLQVEGNLEYHKQVDEKLNLLLQRVYQGNAFVEAQELGAAMPRGFTMPLINRNAWEMANTIGAIHHMEFSLASDLSRLYNQQAFYQSKLDMVSQNFYVAGNINTENQAATSAAFSLLVGDIVIQEERLIPRYEAMIARIDSLGF